MSQITSTDFQRMTGLPEDLERALLDLPMGALLKPLGLAGASDKYLAVQRLAREFPEAKLRKLVRSGGQGVVQEAPAAPDPQPLGGRLLPATLVALAEGRTAIQPGSLRAQVLKALVGGALTLAQLGERLGFDPKPVVAKLRAAGWVTTT